MTALLKHDSAVFHPLKAWTWSSSSSWTKTNTFSAGFCLVSTIVCTSSGRKIFLSLSFLLLSTLNTSHLSSTSGFTQQRCPRCTKWGSVRELRRGTSLEKLLLSVTFYSVWSQLLMALNLFCSRVSAGFYSVYFHLSAAGNSTETEWICFTL